MPGISPAKAATLCGTAFRNNVDAVLIGALRRHGWSRAYAMVSCESINTTGTRRFFVRVSYRGQEDVTVHHDLDRDDYMRANEETFSILGELLASKANTELEKIFMGVD